MSDDIKLPPLSPAENKGGFYSSREIERYTRAAVLADRQQRGMVEDERAAFEREYPKHYGSRQGIFDQDGRGVYADKQVQAAFSLWQARAALAAPTIRNPQIVEPSGNPGELTAQKEGESTALIISALYGVCNAGEAIGIGPAGFPIGLVDLDAQIKKAYRALADYQQRHEESPAEKAKQ